MSPQFTCRHCFGGGFRLMHMGHPNPEEVSCEVCNGTGLVGCQQCEDTGWMPVMDVYGQYAHDEPCVCHLGHMVMRQPDTDVMHERAF